MEFQLRESNTTTLKEMKDNSISVEDNFLIKRSNIKAKERKKIKREQHKYSEANIDIMTSK